MARPESSEWSAGVLSPHSLSDQSGSERERDRESVRERESGYRRRNKRVNER